MLNTWSSKNILANHLFLHSWRIGRLLGCKGQSSIIELQSFVALTDADQTCCQFQFRFSHWLWKWKERVSMQHLGVIGWKYGNWKETGLRLGRIHVGVMVQVKVFGAKWDLWKESGLEGYKWEWWVWSRVGGDLPDSGSGKPPPERCWATQPPKNPQMFGGVLGNKKENSHNGFSSWKMFASCGKIWSNSLKLKKGRVGAVLRFWKPQEGGKKCFIWTSKLLTPA